MTPTWAEIQAMNKAKLAGNKPRKYRNVPTEYGGVRYDSKAEAVYAERLDLWVLLEHIRGWVRQVSFQLGSDFKTRVDFLVIDNEMKCEAHEIKGHEIAQFKTVRRLWPKYAPCPLVIVKESRTRKWTFETIEGKPSKEGKPDDHDQEWIDQNF